MLIFFLMSSANCQKLFEMPMKNADTRCAASSHINDCHLCDIALFKLGNEPVFPPAGTAQRQGQKFRPAIMELRVGFPCETDTAMYLNAFLRGEAIGFGR